MTFLVLLVFAFKRLKSRVSLAALLILATAMTVGIIVCIPVFADAVSRQIMKQELGIGRLKHRPPFAVRFHASGQARFPITLEDAEGYRAWLHQILVSSVGLPTEAAYMQANSRRFDLLPREGDTRYKQERLGNASVFTVDEIEEHVRIVSGEPIGAGIDSPDYLPLWVEEGFAAARALQVGEFYELGDLFDPSIQRIPVRIVATWERIDPEEQYWYTDPSWNLDQNLYTTPQAYARHVYPRYEAAARYVFWYFIFDEGRMNLSRADHYVAALESVGREVAERLPAGTMEGAPIEQLLRGQTRKQDLILLFSGVSLPLVAITLYFLGAMSVIYNRLQAQETAVLTSRGSSRVQIVGLAAIETAVILLFALPLGIALGMFVASILGYSSSFLSFVPREPLQVNLASMDWRLVALAAAITVVFRVVPSWSLSRLTLVLHERQSARRPLLWGSARLLLIGFLAVATVYGYQQLVASGSLSLVSWTPNDPTHDPLILIAPSLFLLTVPLIFAELFVLLARPLAWVGRLLPGISGYLGLVDLSREGGRYRTPVYLLVLSLSIGVFYASLARSADRWLVDRRQYEIGSDLTFKPRTEEDNLKDGGSSTGMELAQGLARLPVSDYERIEGVRAVSPVGQYKAAVQAGKVQASGRLLAVDRIRFAEVTYYREDYSTRSLGEMLNRLGAERAGILVPNAVARQLEVGEGDNIRLNVQLEENQWYSFEFTIVGTFDYFPTMLTEGEHTFVTNLDYLQTETGGLLPYGLWMRVAPGADSERIAGEVERATQQGLVSVGNLPLVLTEDYARLERVGIFGLLSVSFIGGALLSLLGLLLHSASIVRERTVRFAVLRALGMGRGRVMLTLLVEWGLALGYSIVVGTAMGIMGARLYVPYLQLTEVRGVPIPPYLPYIDNARALWIAVIMTVVLIFVLSMLLVRLVRARVFEILRLGMRE